MASIKGIQLKAVKLLEGTEGLGFSGNIYIESKKIGSVHDFANGAEATINILPEYKDIINRKAKEFCKEQGNNGYDSYFEQILLVDAVFELAMLEKDFKNEIKKGYIGIATLKDINESLEDRPVKVPKQVSLSNNSDAEQLYELGYNRVVIYKDLGDFNLS